MATFFVGADAPSFHTFNQVWVDGYGWCTCLPAPYQPLQQQEAMNTWVGGYPAAHLYPVRQLTSSLFVFALSEMTRFNTFIVITIFLASQLECADVSATSGPNPAAREISVSLRKHTHTNNRKLTFKMVKLVVCDASQLFFIDLKHKQRTSE